MLVHLAVALFGFLFPSQPMGDVHNVYDPWSTWAIDGQAIVGITEPWVYPQLALIPMVLAQGLSWAVDYQVAWAVLVTIADALAFALLVGRGRSRGRRTAASFWLAFVLLLGPVGMYRLEGVTVPLAIAGCLWLIGRPWLGAILLAVAMWIKVWPAALLAAAVIAVRRRWAVVGGTLVVSALTLAVALSAGAGGRAFGFITDQADRGLQLEAPVSAWWLWRAVLRIPDSAISYDHDMLTFEVVGPGVDAASAVMTPLLVACAVGVAALGAYRAWRGATFASLFPPLSLAFVLVLILFNKVGSPQYMSWLIAPLVMGLVIDRRRWAGPAILGLGMALITQLVYPLLYAGLLGAAPLPAALLTVRNALVAVMLVWVFVRLTRPAHRAPTLVRSTTTHP